VPGSPPRARLASPDEPGERLLVTGVISNACQTPATGHVLDVWGADETGAYHSVTRFYRLRGHVTTDERGFFAFETIIPGRYAEGDGFRPSHLHAKVFAPNGQTVLTTQLYFEGDPYLYPNDSCPITTCKSNDPDRILATNRAKWGEQIGEWAQVHIALS
ncbi:MAG: hypothetical protein KC416_14755, partial [Myxococcales bacterium]|nr:hypothetical protein [Myxococcales bacterium]